MIRLKNIGFSYKNGENVFDGFSLDLNEGKITCVLGSSASGKTTLLNILAGLNKINSGHMENCPDTVSYVFQQPRLIMQKTVFQNLDYALKGAFKDKSRRREIITEGLESVGLTVSEGGNARLSDMEKYPNALSGGAAQRVSLCRAFCLPSSLLLMDEPFKELDDALKNSVRGVFLSLYERDKKTVVFVTHDVEEALMCADKIVVLPKEHPIRAAFELELLTPRGERTEKTEEIVKARKILTGIS